MWYVLAYRLDDEQDELYSLGSYSDQVRAVDVADWSNREEKHVMRYFVVHTSELPLFGLQAPAESTPATPG